MTSYRDSIVQISEAALLQNLNFYKTTLTKTSKIILVLKANSYGAGCARVAELFKNEPTIEYYAVASVNEGIELRFIGITKAIMVLNMDIEEFKLAIKNNLEPVIISPAYVEKLIEVSNDYDQKIKIHINLDTGLHRVGFKPNEMEHLGKTLNSNPNLKVASVFSHYLGSGQTAYDYYSLKQLDEFKKTSNELITLIGYQPKLHVDNTGGAERFTNEKLDLHRIGIGLYGLSVSETKLQNVFTWKTTVAHIQIIEKDESVSYNRSWIAPKKSTIATVFVGYADGLNRRLSNGNWSFKKGRQQLPIVGDICMDLCMIDVTGVEIKIGDQLDILNSVEDIEHMANVLETISYEVLTSISPRIEREYV